MGSSLPSPGRFGRVERFRQKKHARAQYYQSLHHAVRARATELAASLPADAVESALLTALSTATVQGRWGDVAQLAAELEGRRRARAATMDLGAVRARKRER